MTDVLYAVDAQIRSNYKSVAAVSLRHIPIDGEYYVSVKKVKMPKSNLKKSPLFFILNPFNNEAVSRYDFGIAEYRSEAFSAIVIRLDIGGTLGLGLPHLHIPFRNFDKLIKQAESAINYFILNFHIITNTNLI